MSYERFCAPETLNADALNGRGEELTRLKLTFRVIMVSS